jgi:hypothetical protein
MSHPDWLTKRNGSITPGVEGSMFVVLDGKPLYRLDARPAAGKVACAVTQTANGKRLDSGAVYPDVPAAFNGGLEELKTRLGW